MAVRQGYSPSINIPERGRMVQFQSARDRLFNHCLFLGGGFHIRKVSFGFSPDFDVSTPHRHLHFFTPHYSRCKSTQSLPDLFYFIRTTQWGDWICPVTLQNGSGQRMGCEPRSKAFKRYQRALHSEWSWLIKRVISNISTLNSSSYLVTIWWMFQMEKNGSGKPTPTLLTDIM